MKTIKKFLNSMTIFFLAAILLMPLSSCRNAQPQQSANAVPNPIKTYKSYGEVNKALGFDMVTLPESLNFTPTAYETINDKIGQLTYAKTPAGQAGTEPSDNPSDKTPLELTLRMAKGDEDISGIYGVNYGLETIKNIDINIGVYQNTTYIAWWLYDGMSYSLTATNIDNVEFNDVTDAVIAEVLGTGAKNK